MRRRLLARINRRNDQVDLEYCFYGDWSQLNYGTNVKNKAGIRKDELWKATCMEAFIGNAKSYFEINLAPNGDWNVYHFCGYRKGMQRAKANLISSQYLKAQNHFTFRYIIQIQGLENLKNKKASLTAVTQNLRGSVSYWSTLHTQEKPNFHAPESFILPL